MSKTNLGYDRHYIGPRRYRYGPSVGPWPSSDETTYVASLDFHKFRASVNTPGFRDLSRAARKALPPNAFSFSERSISHPYGVMELNGYSNHDRIDGFLSGSAPVNFVPRGITNVDRNRIDLEAQLASLLKLKDQKVNVGVSLGEMRETSDLVLHTAKRIGTSYRAARRGDLKGALDAVSNSADARRISGKMARGHNDWETPYLRRRNNASASSEILAVQLGWKPLLTDVGNYLDLLENRKNNFRYMQTSSKSHRWSGTFGPDDYWQGVNAGRTEFGIYTRKYGFVFSNPNEFTHTLASVGLTNPLSWLWELTPLSFVADWFLKIGSYIDALDATLGLQFESGYTTKFEKSAVRYNCKGSALGPYGTWTVSARASSRVVECTRIPLSEFPSIPPILKGTGLKWSRGITASALIRQYFKK